MRRHDRIFTLMFGRVRACAHIVQILRGSRHRGWQGDPGRWADQQPALAPGAPGHHGPCESAVGLWRGDREAQSTLPRLVLSVSQVCGGRRGEGGWGSNAVVVVLVLRPNGLSLLRPPFLRWLSLPAHTPALFKTSRPWAMTGTPTWAPLFLSKEACSDCRPQRTRVVMRQCEGVYNATMTSDFLACTPARKQSRIQHVRT